MAGHPAVNDVVEAAVLRVAQNMEDQLDAELHQMDKLGEVEVERLRISRLEQMRRHQEKQREWRRRGHGEYHHLVSEKEFFAAMKGEDKMVCHFFRSNWPCTVMDKHLEALCKQHIECKFTKIDAEKSPYLTDKLKIWMLPTLALVRNEKIVDYVVGLDDLGGRDDFTTEVLAGRLAGGGVINYSPGGTVKGSHGEAKRNVRKGEYVQCGHEDDEDSDFE